MGFVNSGVPTWTLRLSAVAATVLLLAGWLGGGRMEAFTPASAALMVYMVLLSALAFGTWSALLKYNSIGKVTIFNFLIPVFGVVLSAIFLGENMFAWKNAVALVLVCAGIWLVTAESRGALPAAIRTRAATDAI